MILGMDTSSEWVVVAVGRPGHLVAGAVSAEPMTHAEMLAPLIRTTLAEAGVSVEELESIVVGVGPGPFTGLRVGLVTARTLGYVLGIPVRGVCSLDLIALDVSRESAPDGFVVATDARRKEVYFASYDSSGRRVSPPEVGRPEVAATEAPTAGRGAALYPDHFPSPCEPAIPSPAALLAACVPGAGVALGDPDPMYLRRPDAQTPGKPKAVS